MILQFHNLKGFRAKQRRSQVSEGESVFNSLNTRIVSSSQMLCSALGPIFFMIRTKTYCEIYKEECFQMA